MILCIEEMLKNVLNTEIYNCGQKCIYRCHWTIFLEAWYGPGMYLCNILLTFVSFLSFYSFPSTEVYTSKYNCCRIAFEETSPGSIEDCLSVGLSHYISVLPFHVYPWTLCWIGRIFKLFETTFSLWAFWLLKMNWVGSHWRSLFKIPFSKFFKKNHWAKTFWHIKEMDGKIKIRWPNFVKYSSIWSLR